jgi:crotonobetainyl-CoA:carnitine CoA-transferase CaiB-like acyl-CoA transferase
VDIHEEGPQRLPDRTRPDQHGGQDQADEFGVDRQRPGIGRQPPRIGEHNAEVLNEAGFTTAEIAGLAEAGVIAARTREGR